MPAPTTPPRRVEIVDPLRGLAAAGVAWFHLTNGSQLLPADSWLRASGAYGWLGVEIFFVISGFVIPYSMSGGNFRSPRHLGVFFAKRVTRLDPPYLAAIALTLGLSYASALAPGFAGQQPTVSAPQLLAHLGYLNAFLGFEWLSPVFWTLAIEFQFYILIALSYPLFRSERRAVRLAALALLGGSGLVVADGSLVFRYGGLFAMGIAAFQWRVGMWRAATFGAILTGLTAAAALSLGWLPALTGLVAVTLIAVVNVRRFAWPALLGSISYSLYLLHVPVGGRIVNLGTRYADSPVSQVAVLAVAALSSLAAAYALYRLVERPSQRWSSAFRYRPTGSPTK